MSSSLSSKNDNNSDVREQNVTIEKNCHLGQLENKHIQENPDEQTPNVVVANLSISVVSDVSPSAVTDNNASTLTQWSSQQKTHTMS